MNVLLPGEYERDATFLQHERSDSGNSNTREGGRERPTGGTVRLKTRPAVNVLLPGECEMLHDFYKDKTPQETLKRERGRERGRQEGLEN